MEHKKYKISLQTERGYKVVGETDLEAKEYIFNKQQLTAKERINKLFEELLMPIKNNLQKFFTHNLKIEDNIIWDENKMICSLLQNSELMIFEEYQKYFDVAELSLLEDVKVKGYPKNIDEFLKYLNMKYEELDVVSEFEFEKGYNVLQYTNKKNGYTTSVIDNEGCTDHIFLALTGIKHKKIKTQKDFQEFEHYLKEFLKWEPTPFEGDENE